MGYQCTQSVDVCRLRVAVLAEDGAPDPGAGNLYVTDALIKLDYKVNLKAGAKFNQENGCGNTCMTYQAPDEIESVDVALELCMLDAELIGVITGYPVTDIGGVPRLWSLPAIGVPLDHDISVEAWSKAWDVGRQATDGSGNLLWHQFIFPSGTYNLGDSSLSHNPLALPFNGHCRSNPAFGDGPGNDVPWGSVVGPMAEGITNTQPPTATCGAQALVAS